MGGKAKAPPPPDYKALAQQQAELQNQQLKLQTEANRPDQVGPMGSVKWSQDPETGQWTQTESWDPRLQQAMDQSLDLQSSQIGQIQDLMGQGGFQGGPAMPTYSPYDVQRGAMPSFDAAAINRGTMPTYDQAAGEQYAQRFTESLMGRMRPQQAQDQESMATKLRLQGLQPGTEAYDRAYKNLLTSQGDVNAQANLQGLLAGGQEARNIYQTQLGGQQQDFAQQLGLSGDAMQRYQAQLGGQQQDFAQQMGLAGQGLDAYQAQLAGQQQGYGQSLQNYLLPWQTASMTQGLAQNVQQPDFQSFHGAGVGQGADVLGSAQQQYAQQMQGVNEQNQQKQGKGQSIGTVVGGVAGSFFGPLGTAAGAQLGGMAGGAIASDLNLKTDVREIDDETAYEVMLKMIPISWAWTGTSVRDSGISAQQVLELLPELVNRGERGLLMVNYSKLFGILLGAFRYMAKKEAERGHADA